MACLPVVQHQAEAVALVSRTRLRAVADVVAIRRIERSLIRRFVVGSDVLGLSQNLGGRRVRLYVDWNRTQIIVGRNRRNRCLVGGVANTATIRTIDLIYLAI